MSDIGLRSKMLVRDVMSSPVITIQEDASTNRVAELMDKHGLGCVIITSEEGKPVGIITERDLVGRVVTKNVKPDSIRVKEVMTSPLITIESGETISQAARRMNRLNIRRLGVIYKGNLVGVLSSKDVLAVMPELIETIQEQALIEGENRVQEAEEESKPLAGYCDSCESWSDDLKEVDGEFLCEDCRIELEEEE
ncbi:MAG: CBS domain-containing protein [Candidatus Bathyarchaeota archaeon]|nr:CBS domain-containing protein [Candidatus Bathyarchaeota archaeon]